MTSDEYTVILVYSTSHALRAERVLAKVGIPCKLIPVPRHLSSDCGVCVRIDQANKERVLQELEGARVEIEGIHEI
jgi:uncharacterized SAM-binding protein YcdF (DUF218 family)